MDLHLQWYKTVVLKRCFAFKGRACKREYWTFFFMTVIISSILDMMDKSQPGMANIGILFTLSSLTPWAAVSIRRLHDTGKSGWWTLLMFFPMVDVYLYGHAAFFSCGVFYLFYLNARPSEPGENKYGEPAPTEP